MNLRNPVHKFSHRVLRGMLPDGGSLDGLLELIPLSISQIAWRLVKEMDEAGIEISTPLMMDMAYCGGFGGPAKSFDHQMGETADAVQAVNDHYGRIRLMPFVAADPRRDNVADIVINALKGGVFKGVKIYPVMGYKPDHGRLLPVYHYCSEAGVPVTTHCENGGIPGLDGYYHLADPVYWEQVLKKFKNLKLNLAHNDRTGSEWQKKIARLITSYPNVYTDISYNVEMWYMPRKYFKSIKRMLNAPETKGRVLYGTDWYMGRWLWTEASYLNWFTAYSRKIFWCRVSFSDDEIRRLTEDNPKQFLGL